MESPRDGLDLTAELRALRPAPRLEFAARLDANVAAGFHRGPRSGRAPFAAFAAHLRRDFSRRRLALATCGAALAAVAVATALIADNHSSPQPVALDNLAPKRPRHVQYYSGLGEAAGRPAAPSAANGSAEAQLFAAPNAPGRVTHSAATSQSHRDVERSAEIGLLAEPADVAEDAARVFSAVHDAGGIVLNSTTTQGQHAGAHFELLIPSGKLGDALAAFSQIDEVRTRHEATADITAPTVAAGERLRESRARIDGLLAQLTVAESETEAVAIEAELRGERRHAAALRSQLSNLHHRTTFSQVDVRIESGASTGSGGGWGIDDALDDAGHLLGVAAGVTLVGLAVLAPLALLALLAWLIHLAWLRRTRHRALDA